MILEQALVFSHSKKLTQKYNSKQESTHTFLVSLYQSFSIYQIPIP